jgi:YggT family protein
MARPFVFALHLPRLDAKVKPNAAEGSCPSGGRRIPLPQQLVFTPSFLPARRPPLMTSLLQILLMILNIAQWIILAHIIMSWLINFQVLNLRQPLVAQIWYGLNRLLDPIYSRLRQFLPNLGGLDLAPLIAILVIYALRIILINNAAAFY